MEQIEQERGDSTHRGSSPFDTEGWPGIAHLDYVPDLPPSVTDEEKSRRGSDVYERPNLNAHEDGGDVWTGQPNVF